MKTKILNILLLSVLALGWTACSSDDPDLDISVIEPGVTEKNDFDKWLEANFNKPYNIDFKYRYEDIESDYNYYLVPARYEDAVVMAHIVKHLCVEAYNEASSTDFTCRYFPKMFYFVGDWEYRNNGTAILGTAEGGLKIFIGGLNYLTEYMKSAARLNHYYIETIHHEFTHILNQNHTIPADFQTITSTGYVSDMWNESPYTTGYLERGFISSYGQHSYQEDFAEMMALYVTSDKKTWDGLLAEAGENGASLITQKLDILRDYMLTNFNINIDNMRQIISRRQDELVSGRVDLTDITVK